MPPLASVRASGSQPATLRRCAHLAPRRIDDDDRVGKLAVQHHVMRILDEMRQVHELMRQQRQASVVVLERELPKSEIILSDMEFLHDGDRAFFRRRAAPGSRIMERLRSSALAPRRRAT